MGTRGQGDGDNSVDITDPWCSCHRKLYRQKVPVLTTVRTGWLSIRLSASYLLVNNWRFPMEAPDSDVIPSSGLQRREVLFQSNTWVRGGKSSPRVDIPGSIVLPDSKCVKETCRGKPSPKCPFYMLNHCTLETEIKSFVPRAVSLFLFPELSLLCHSFFGELCSAETLHVAAALSPSSKAHWLRSGLWKTTRMMTACNHTNGQITTGF